ncbi:MAG TPA: hypothetical protein VFZ20_07775 [Longimicrobium sp.]|nr:hypothetical protein [Longimicrobium sp.]
MNTPLRSHPAAHAGRFARAAAPLLLAALAACAGDGTGPGEAKPGSVAFAYSGSGPEGTIQGTYQVLRDPVGLVPRLTESYALGQRVESQGVLRVVANMAREGQRADFAQVTIPRLTVGSEAITGICPGESCAAVSLGIDLATGGVSQAKYSCSLDQGIIRIFSIQNGRAEGEFSGTGSCVGAPGTADLEEFSITGGTFDVKVRDVPG